MRSFEKLTSYIPLRKSESGGSKQHGFYDFHLVNITLIYSPHH